MVKSGVYHDMRTMILALDHPTSVALPFFYAFSGCDIVSSFFILKKNVRDGTSGYSIGSTLMRYLYVLEIDRAM